ncbi:hypothetical protein ACIQ57_13290 [Lysinibacillus xylanilyticus]|uniref:hypothetical protein n=1 Tax=Lysinibacillus xylanilyticus TaxID=582475 RepID=UPI00382BC7B2
MFYLCESEATATNVLSVRKRSVSGKAPSQSGNQPHVMTMNLFNTYKSIMEGEFAIGDENIADRR